MKNAMEIEVTKVLDVEITSVEEGCTGIYREIIIESENGNLVIKLYASNSPSEIKVLI
jgi:hypothetical protein